MQVVRSCVRIHRGRLMLKVQIAEKKCKKQLEMVVTRAIGLWILDLRPISRTPPLGGKIRSWRRTWTSGYWFMDGVVSIQIDWASLDELCGGYFIGDGLYVRSTHAMVNSIWSSPKISSKIDNTMFFGLKQPDENSGA